MYRNHIHVIIIKYIVIIIHLLPPLMPGSLWEAEAKLETGGSKTNGCDHSYLNHSPFVIIMCSYGRQEVT